MIPVSQRAPILAERALICRRDTKEGAQMREKYLRGCEPYLGSHFISYL